MTNIVLQMNKNCVIKVLGFLLLAILCLNTVVAYTGSFAFAPPLTGGPDTKETTMFTLDTETSNPQEIITDLKFVYKVVIETDPAYEGEPFHVKEYPDGDDPAWDFIVPKKVNDDLVKATVYFWAPEDSDATITIIHQHTGEPDVTLIATRVSPEVSDGAGRVLYVFETTSFSSFFVNKKTERIVHVPFLALTLLTACTFLPAVLLRKH